MFKLGNIEVQGKVILAPMAGVTFEGYRKYINSFGCSLCYSEMVSDMGLIYQNIETINYVKFEKDVCPTGVQLFGNNPEELKKALLICESINPNIDFYDVNMGCPVPKVTKPGSGSAIMANPELAKEIIKALKSVTNKPVTAKIRLGYSGINFMEVIEKLIEGGVDAIAIHPRTRKELYMGEPHWDLIKDLRDKIPVPLIVSGNIYTLNDAIKALEISKADAVMVARGAMGNPFLVKQIDTYFKTGEILPDPNINEQKKYCIELAQSIIKDKGEDTAMRIYRSIAPRFFSGFPNSKYIRNKLATSLITYQSLLDILNELPM